jgi:hypothetical protein
MAAKLETLSASSESSSDDSTSNSDSSNSSPESDAENSDDDNVDLRTKKSKKDRKSFDASTKDPLEEAKKYNLRYSLLMERINAINQVRFPGHISSHSIKEYRLARRIMNDTRPLFRMSMFLFYLVSC